MCSMRIARTAAELRRSVAAWRAAGERVALVPTMGALHGGHLSLMALARRRADRSVASLFVNPRQFGPGEDMARYPRDEAGDARLLREAGVDLLYAPGAEAIYPPGFATLVSVAGPACGLEACHRPRFFDGVATVVARLLLQALPDEAIFGEKDYQQLLVVRRLALDLDLPTRIAAAPTVREADGLAMSSRNAWLDADGRRRAPALYRALETAAAALAAGTAPADALAAGRAALRAAFDRVDYLEWRDAATLAPLAAAERPGRLLAAVRLGPVRLIDNVAVAGGQP